MRDVKTIGLVGGGVIGAGWAARFLLNGYDVKVFDPDPEVERKVKTVLANAKRAQAKLTPGVAIPEGNLVIAASAVDAVTGADFVQESLPEREGVDFEPLLWRLGQAMENRIREEQDRIAGPGPGKGEQP